MDNLNKINKPTIALFDLDKTLIPGDSDHGWGAFLVRHGYVDADYYANKNDYFYERYNEGTLDIHEYCEFSFKVLKENDMATLNAWRAQYFAEEIQPMLRPQALALVKKHLDAGHLCALVTATNDFITAPIAQVFGIPHLIATRAEVVDGCYTGKIAGTPNFQAGKITNVVEWLAARSLSFDAVAASYFYSDSMNDLPLLELVTFPVVVHPDATLAAVAKTKHWPCIQLFHAEYVE